MAGSRTRLTTVVFSLFLFVIVVGVVAVPTAYFVISYQYMRGILAAETEIYAQTIEQLIGSNPELWEYSEPRLNEYLSRRPRSGVFESRYVFNRDRKLVVANTEALPPPIIKSSYELYDSGRIAGFIVIERSFQPLLFRTFVLAVALLFAAGVLIVLAMRYPLRILNHSEEEVYTALQKAEKERAKSDSVIAAIGDGMCIIERDQAVIYQNSIHAGIFGELTGKHYSDVCADRREECEQVFIDGGSFIVEHVLEKEGETVIMESKFSPLVDSDGNAIAVIELVRDITERKRLEERLSQTQKMEAVGQLAGGVAHDFNNILTAIIGYANLTLMKMPGSDPLRSNIDQIIAASEKAAGLTGSLLAFSRKQIINPKKQDLNSIIRTMEKLLKRVIGEDIALETDLSEEILLVNCDQTQMQQVLLNLSTNARDAMPKGGRLIIRSGKVILDSDFVRTYGYGDTGIYAQISVTDTGCGIDDDVMGRIFDPFYTTKQTGKGTGLGLSIVYGIVKQHDGFVNVYSEKSHGTSFSVYLPLVSGAAGLEEAISSQEHERLYGGTETILLAEDDHMLRQLTGRILQEFGYKVIEAENGEDAVIKYRVHSDQIDIAVLDVVMPKMNGKEVLAEIRKIDPRLKVLFMSGYTADILHVKDILNENMAFLYKPVAPRELLKQVRSVLSSEAVS